MDLATAIGDDFNQFRQSSSSSRHAIFSLVPTLVHHISHALRGELHIVRSERKASIMGLGGHLADPSTIISHDWSRAIQIVATISSAFSLLGTMVTIYWFFMMRRNFRRNLILYLVLADFFKSLWYISFSLVSLHRGSIDTKGSFCQGFGFLLQASTMACDYAILVMSVHMYLQIFSTTSKIFGHDGLYRFRHTVMAGWFTFPFLCGILAFVRGREGYIAQGPFCSLPIRPYWYRLALQWIPRYLIWLYIMIVAIRIYLHVGQGFRVFAREDDKASSDGFGGESSNPTDNGGRQELRVVKKRGQNAGELQDLSGLVGSDVASSPAPSSSHSTWPLSLNFSADGFRLPSANHSRRSSQANIHPDGTVHADTLQVPPDMKAPRHSISSMSSWRTSADLSAGLNSPSVNLAPIEEMHATSGSHMDLASTDTPLKKRRQAIQRQLRLLFIYPVTYLMVWTVPFVYHSMYYSDYYAANPIPILALLTCFSLTIAGFIDCIVFGWREKPWQHVPGADGTFLGSFKFWTFKNNQRRNWSTPAPGRVPSLAMADDPAGPARQHSKNAKHLSAASRQTSGNSTKPILTMHKKTYSGTSDRATKAAEQAAERLALERRDRQSRMSTRVSSANPTGEWFERRLSECVSPSHEKEGFDFNV